jgi:hypothetical protein
LPLQGGFLLQYKLLGTVKKAVNMSFGLMNCFVQHLKITARQSLLRKRRPAGDIITRGAGISGRRWFNPNEHDDVCGMLAANKCSSAVNLLLMPGYPELIHDRPRCAVFIIIFFSFRIC